MKRLRHILANSLVVLSALACLATILLWVQNERVTTGGRLAFRGKQTLWVSLRGPIMSLNAISRNGSITFLWARLTPECATPWRTDWRTDYGSLDNYVFQGGVHPSIKDIFGAKIGLLLVPTIIPWDDDPAEPQVVQRTASVDGRDVEIPDWILIALSAILPFRLTLAQYRKRIRIRRAASGLCPNCSYDLTANTSGRCPECGTEVANVTQRSIA